MAPRTRRSFLTVSGAVIGGIAIGSDVVAATVADRYIVDTRSLRDGDLADLDVIHDLSAVDLAVVKASERDVESLGVSYGADSVYTLDLPHGRQGTRELDAVDETFYPLQWDKQAQEIQAVHQKTRGEGSRVAVIDTGVDPTHPDLAPAVNTSLSANMTDDGGDYGDIGYHGTHVSGIVAADDRNDMGVVGSAPGTDLVALRVFGAEGGASFGDIMAAIVYAAAVGCDAANMSLGAYPVPRQGLGSFYGQVLNRITNYANANGTLLVGAAGNDAADLQHDKNLISLPNEAPNVMSVSATGPIGFGWGDAGLEEPPVEPAIYTNYGTNAVSVSAHGGNYDPEAVEDGAQGWWYDLVLNTIPGGWAWLAGTSMAAPQVAAAAGLVKSENPDYNANQVRATLERTADSVGEKAYHGAGALNPLEAVRD